MGGMSRGRDDIWGLILLSEAWWTAPRRGQADRPGVPRMLGGIWGCILSELKEYTPRPPKKNSGRDGVVTSSISLAAAQRAPAHSFRCSSFSHRKTLRWEPCISPLTTPLKRPKERPAGLSFGNLSGVTGDFYYGGRWDGGRRMGAGYPLSFRGPCLTKDECEDGSVVLAPALGGYCPPGDGGRHAESSCPTDEGRGTRDGGMRGRRVLGGGRGGKFF